MSLPYPEPGIRLIRQDDIATFDVQMTTLQAELDEAVTQLDQHFGELKAAARERLGRLYNSADYPDSLRGLFELEYDFPAVEPPDYLRQLEPGALRAGDKPAWLPASTRPCGWPKKRSPANWPSWSPI